MLSLQSVLPPLCLCDATPADAVHCLTMQYTESMKWEIAGAAPSLKSFLLDTLRPLGVTAWYPARWNTWKVVGNGTNLVGTLLIDM
jgi:hypothetical protein